MDSRFFTSIFILLAGIGGLTSCNQSVAQAATSTGKENSITKEVRLIVPQKRTADISIKEGVTLAPEERGSVTSDLSATLKTWLVEEHQYVKKDQPIAQLDATDYELMLEQAKGQLAALEVQFLSVEKDVLRLKSLLDSQSIPKQQYDNAEARMLAMQRQIDSAKKGVDLTARRVEKSLVRAPFSGIITEKKVAAGYHIVIAMPGSGDIAYIEKTDRLKVVINFSESFFSEVEKGTKVDFFIPSINKTVSSKIYSKSDSINSTKKFAAICYIDNAKHDIPAGTFAYASITSKNKTRIIVPSMSLKRMTNNGGEVYSVDQKGLVVAHKVFVGFPYEDGIEITGSIPEAIIADAASVFPGEQVQTTTIH